MAAPVYLTPSYVTFDMILPLLNQANIKVVYDDTDTSGVYQGTVETIMAGAESNIITTILSNFVALPLATTDGGSFDDLLDNPLWKNTYIQLRTVFIAKSMVDLLLNKMNTEGRLAEAGSKLLDSQYRIVNNFTAVANKVDQAGNLQFKNILVGLEACANASSRIGGKAVSPTGLPTGGDRSYQAINSVPNYRGVK